MGALYFRLVRKSVNLRFNFEAEIFCKAGFQPAKTPIFKKFQAGSLTYKSSAIKSLANSTSPGKVVRASATRSPLAYLPVG